MTLKQAALTSMWEFNLRRKGWDKKERDEWEKARWIAWQGWLHAPFVKNGPKSPSALFRFPDEALTSDNIAPEDCHVSPEIEEALNELYKDFKRRQDNEHT